MPLTNVGRNLIAAAIIGDAYTTFSNANAHIGVGDGDTAFAVTQTDLQGANKFRQPMEAAFPTRDVNMLSFKAIMGPDDANFAWQEWAIFNADAAGDMINRLVEYNGTKISGQTWIFECELIINIGS